MSTACTARIGRDSGNTTRVNSVHSPAPSRRAASSRSLGIVIMNCRNRKTLNATTSVGSAIPTNVFVSSSLLRIRYVGIIVTWIGIIIVANTRANMTPFPRKRYLAKRVAGHRGEEHPDEADRDDERGCCGGSGRSRARRRASDSCRASACGAAVSAGTRPISVSGFTDVSTIQMNGSDGQQCAEGEHPADGPGDPRASRTHRCPAICRAAAARSRRR